MIIFPPIHKLRGRLPIIRLRFLEQENSRFYFTFLLRNFATGLVAIFEPIYYFEYFHKSISSVLVLYALLFGSIGVLCYWTIKFTGRIGLKRSIILSFPASLLYYFLLFNLDASPFLLIPTFIVWVAAILLFWMPVNIYFGIVANKTKLGREVGTFNILMGLSLALGPLAGGIILANLGWPALFLSVILLLLFTGIPLFFSPELHEYYTVSLNDVAKEIVKRSYLPKAFAFAANGAEFVIKGVIWPLFLFVLGIQFESIGIIAAGALLAGTVFTFGIGVLTDRISKHGLLAGGSLLLSFAWVVSVFVRTSFSAFLANLFYGMASAVAMVPFMAIFYKDFDASRSHIIVLREITLGIGRAGILLLFAILFLFTHAFILTFLGAALLVPLFNLLTVGDRSRTS